jgi:transcriptional regulator with XRE-family HTH domain
MTAQVDRQVELVGARIRSLRRARSLTLVQLAEQSGLSHPFLSQVENGRARPSFASLDRIARALGTTQVDLFAVLAQSGRNSTPTEGVVVIDSGAVSGPFAEGTARVFETGAVSFTPMEITANTRDFGEYFVHDEEEFCYVLEGSVEADLAGKVVPLRAGQAIYYRGGMPHRWRSSDGGTFRLLYIKQRLDHAEAPTPPGVGSGPAA